MRTTSCSHHNRMPVALIWVAIVQVVVPTLFVIATTSSSSFDPDRLVYVNISKQDIQPYSNLTIFTHENRNVYLLQSTFAWTVQVPNNNNNNSDYVPHLERTSQQARQHACQWATNGGPFHADGTSVGIVVSNGHMIHENYGGIGFGLYVPPEKQHQRQERSQSQQQSQSKWVLGKLVNASQTVGLQHFVTGFDWLVWEGTNVAVVVEDRSNDSNYNNNETSARVVKSARTAVGIDFDGKLVMLVADGCEKCLRHQGLKLTDLANLLIRHGRVRHAINMDGGGSSVLVQQHGKVLSHPTCLDVPIPCERAVSSVLCLKKNAIFERIEEERR